MKIKTAIENLKYLKYLNVKTIKKILLRIKKVLAKESLGNKQMVKTYYKMLHKKATDSEIADAHLQFKELLKTAGVGFLIILPFSPLTFTILVKLGQAFNIDIIPKSFKEDEEESTEGKS